MTDLLLQQGPAFEVAPQDMMEQVVQLSEPAVEVEAVALAGARGRIDASVSQSGRALRAAISAATQFGRPSPA